MNNLLDFMTSRAGMKFMELFIIIITFMAFLAGLISAIRAQLTPRNNIEYLYGIAWTQWVGVAVLGCLFSFVILTHIKSNKEQ